jgi:TPR repeat protein
VLLVQNISADESVVNIAPYELNPEQLGRLEAQARTGDKAACLKVASYYMLIQDDYKAAAMWYARLAKTGDLEGCYGYGICLMTLEDFDGAKKWLSAAKKLKHPNAESALKELQKQRAKKERSSK